MPYSRLSSLLVLSTLVACATPPEPVTPLPPPDRLALQQTDFSTLPGWRESANFGEVLKAFRRSCGKLTALPSNTALGSTEGVDAGIVKDWRSTCAAANDTKPADAKIYFEQQFIPFKVTNNGKSEGLFTGYYEIGLKGSRTRTDRFRHPVYALPPDVKRYKDQPYFTRAEIDNGALRGTGLELVFVDDPVELFFLHVQGSGRVTLEDGSVIRVGYAGSNGHPYASIGAYLIAKGEARKEEMTAPFLKEWLRANPEEMAEVLQYNPSYIFFRTLSGDDDGPIGAQGVPVTAERSLAVDKTYIPYGLPLWLDTSLPVAGDDGKPLPYQRLFIAQDTGSAIKGIVRGDVFFGHGKRAEALAGHMKQKGEYYALLPRGLVEDRAKKLADEVAKITATPE